METPTKTITIISQEWNSDRDAKILAQAITDIARNNVNVNVTIQRQSTVEDLISGKDRDRGARCGFY